MTGFWAKGCLRHSTDIESNVIKLHQFLFDDENYVPSEMVKKISAKISADTGMYKEGKPVESVGTDGGYVPKATTAAQTKEETKEKGLKPPRAAARARSMGMRDVIDGEYPWGLELETRRERKCDRSAGELRSWDAPVWSPPAARIQASQSREHRQSLRAA